MNNIYPEMITSLPEIEIHLPGLRGWLMQGVNSQLVLFEIEPIGRMPEHSHTAQWGIVLEGEMKLTIAGESRIYQRGDRYFIPEGVKHSAEFLTRVYVMDFFADPNRYQAKEKE